MKFKEIKNKTLEELTTSELGWFLNHLEEIEIKHIANPGMVTIELFSDLSGWVKTSGVDEIAEVDGGQTPIRELRWKAKSKFREMGKIEDEERERIEEQARKRDWEFNFVVEGVSRVAAEALIKAITTSADEADVIIGGGFHEYDEEVGKRE